MLRLAIVGQLMGEGSNAQPILDEHINQSAVALLVILFF